jgi:hypothetical protein
MRANEHSQIVALAQLYISRMILYTTELQKILFCQDYIKRGGRFCANYALPLKL